VFWTFSLVDVISGDVARVNGQLAVARAFGDRNLKSHLRSDPDVKPDDIDQDTELLILASDGLWKVCKTLNLSSVSVIVSKIIIHLCTWVWVSIHYNSQVMANQEAVDITLKIKDPQKAAKQLIAEALKRESRDDISCIVVRFKWKYKSLHLFENQFISLKFYATYVCPFSYVKFNLKLFNPIRWYHSVFLDFLCVDWQSFFFVICIITWSSVKMNIGFYIDNGNRNTWVALAWVTWSSAII